MDMREEIEDAQRAAFRDDVLEGLSGAQKRIPSRWLYDDRGSELFEDITRTPEYYPTRTETAILNDSADAIAAFCGPNATIIEYGAGAGIKIEILLGALESPALYVPIDIAGDFVTASAGRVDERFPDLEVTPVTADFTAAFELPDGIAADGRCGFFPGSTIGNLSKAEAQAFLTRMRRHVGASGKAIVGIDLTKDIETLLAAYDDAGGVTARFETNVLTRINRELSGTFDPGRFGYEARWDGAESAVEMVLVSRAEQAVTVDGRSFAFLKGETIHTESSRKYDRAGFSQLAERAGWRVETILTDAADLFAVALLVAEDCAPGNGRANAFPCLSTRVLSSNPALKRQAAGGCLMSHP